jgi:hypothetical protein
MMIGQTQGVAYDKSNTPMHTKSIPASADNYSPNNATGNSQSFNDRFLGPEGSMYLNNEWKEGLVVLKDNTIMSGIKLRYNIYFQQMQFIRENDTLAFADPEEIKHILMGDMKFIYTEYLDEGVIDHGYFSIFVDGDCRLLVRNVVTYHKTYGNSDCEKDAFFKSCNLYLQKGDHPAKLLSCGKRSICRMLPDKEREIKAFIKVNKLKMKTQEDMARVVNFYNSIN